MRWLRLVGSIKLEVSFAKETYKKDYIVYKRPVISSILLTVATPYQTQIWILALIYYAHEYTYSQTQMSRDTIKHRRGFYHSSKLIHYPSSNLIHIGYHVIRSYHVTLSNTKVDSITHRLRTWMYIRGLFCRGEELPAYIGHVCGYVWLFGANQMDKW